MLDQIQNASLRTTAQRPKITWRLEKFKNRYGKSQNNSSALSVISESVDEDKS